MLRLGDIHNRTRRFEGHTATARCIQVHVGALKASEAADTKKELAKQDQAAVTVPTGALCCRNYSAATATWAQALTVRQHYLGANPCRNMHTTCLQVLS